MTHRAQTRAHASLLARARRHLRDRRSQAQRIEAAATHEVARDEARLQRSRGLTLGDAWSTFWRHPSPWIILVALAGGLAARITLGGPLHLADLWAPLLMVAAFPFVEWVVHVVVLHAKPVEVAGRVLDSRLARDHRRHHADPRDLPLVFIPWQAFLYLFPGSLAIGVLAFDRLGLGLTSFTALAVIGMAYEWVHFLIHSDYRPRTAPYRAIWRNHRLHHYKNENYWFTVTTAGTSDRLLGTNPDPADVETSPTARDLLGAGS